MRDRALLATLAYTFARIGAVVNLRSVLNPNTPTLLLFWRRPPRWLNVVLSLRLEDVAGDPLDPLQISF